jgi:hypothetical protein
MQYSNKQDEHGSGGQHEKYNKINGIIRRHFGKNMRPEIQVRMHNVLSKPATMYGSETWILRSQDCRRIETSQMRFLKVVAGVTLRDRIRSEDVRKRLQTGNVLKISNNIKGNSWNMWNVCLLDVYHGRHIFIHQVGDAT